MWFKTFIQHGGSDNKTVTCNCSISWPFLRKKTWIRPTSSFKTTPSMSSWSAYDVTLWMRVSKSAPSRVLINICIKVHFYKIKSCSDVGNAQRRDVLKREAVKHLSRPSRQTSGRHSVSCSAVHNPFICKHVWKVKKINGNRCSYSGSGYQDKMSGFSSSRLSKSVVNIDEEKKKNSTT